MRFQGWWVTGFAFAGEMAFVAIALDYFGLSEEGIRAIVRGTARCSAVLFLCAFSASSAHFLLRRTWTAWLLRNRRYIGLSFAVSHTVHLLALVALGVWFPHPFIDDELGLSTLVKGGIGYMFIAAMAMTSFDPPKRWLGSRRWRLLHTVGGYYIWASFASIYRALATQHVVFALFAGAMLLALALRVVQVVWQVRQKAAAYIGSRARLTTRHSRPPSAAAEGGG